MADLKNINTSDKTKLLPGFCIVTVSIPADVQINASIGPICELSQPFEGTMH